MVIDGIRSDQFSAELDRVGLSNKHESFIRQMNTYGFRKEEYHPTTNKNRIKFPGQVFAYFNKNLTRDYKDLQAVHATGKRKPIQQERETVSQLQKHTNSQNVMINSLKTELEQEKIKTQALQKFLTNLAQDNRVSNSVQNDVFKFLAITGINALNSNQFLTNSTQITPDYTPVSLAAQNLVQNPVQNIVQNPVQIQNSVQIPQVNQQVLFPTQSLNITIPDQTHSSMFPQKMAPTDENQNIQVTEMTQQSSMEKLLFLIAQQQQHNFGL